MFPWLKLAVLSLAILAYIFIGGRNLNQTEEDAVQLVDLYVIEELTEVTMSWKDSTGDLYNNFSNLASSRPDAGMVFATNGGMFHVSKDPVGLYVENGLTFSELNVSEGEGNFFIEPNGVFSIFSDRYSILTTDEFLLAEIDPIFATQSGPMLIIDGQINQAFNESSDNVFIRSGVCLDGEILKFAISNEEISFYDFSSFLLDTGCVDALYLDGYISQTYAPEINRFDEGLDYGVIISVFE
ncbi:hypothetical protein HON52_03735 [Candidatus Uhrbacteria bacterium]|nr:hypothetical protein [Candidatus Uhrbacteria bacterium]